MKKVLILVFAAAQLAFAAQAQAEGTNYGIALAAMNTPEESSVTSKGYTIDFFMDSDEYRFGVNYGQQALQSLTLTNTTLYGLYNYKIWGIDLYGGAGLNNASLKGTNFDGDYSQSSAGLMYMGAMAYNFDFDSFLMGIQFSLSSRTGKFDGASLATGSNLVQLVATF